MASGVKITGHTELIAAFRKAPDKLRSKALRTALRRAAAIVRDEARRLAPKATGAGAKSIAVWPRRDKTRQQMRFSVGPDREHFYMQFLEFGTRRVSARPFMRPAIEDKQADALEVIAKTIRDAVERGEIMPLKRGRR